MFRRPCTDNYLARHACNAASHVEQSTRDGGLVEEVWDHLGDHVVPARQLLVPPKAAQAHYCLLQLCCAICHLHFMNTTLAASLFMHRDTMAERMWTAELTASCSCAAPSAICTSHQGPAHTGTQLCKLRPAFVHKFFQPMKRCRRIGKHYRQICEPQLRSLTPVSCNMLHRLHSGPAAFLSNLLIGYYCSAAASTVSVAVCEKCCIVHAMQSHRWRLQF